MSNLLRLCLVGMVTLVSCAEKLSNCFECANRGGNRFICSPKNAIGFDVTCCSRGETDELCQENENRVCSKPLDDGP